MTRIDAVAALIVLACTSLVVTRLGLRPVPAAATDTEADRHRFAASVAGSEPHWRRQAEQDFPSDRWSQRDAFHGSEAQSIRDLARGAKVPFETVIRAIDEDIHRTPRFDVDRSAQVVPCKPRPFYD